MVCECTNKKICNEQDVRGLSLSLLRLCARKRTGTPQNMSNEKEVSALFPASTHSCRIEII